MSIIAELAKYPLPVFLEGRITPAVYLKWLDNRAGSLFKRDKKRQKPYISAGSKVVYKEKIHKAIMDSGEFDPYTGEPLAWELIGTWDTSHDQPEGYERKFALLPTIDHITPAALEFEICSWQINKAKSDLDPAEFVALCKSVVNHFSK